MHDSNKANKDDVKNSASSLITAGKDLLTLLRDSSVFTLTFLLFFYPKTLNTILTEAGFEEGSLVGFKWKAKIADTTDALNEARATINDLKDQLDKASKALAAAQTKFNDPELKDKLTKLEKENDRLSATSSEVRDTVANTIASNSTIVEKVQESNESATRWGVVYGGDTSLEAAKYEVKETSAKYGIPNVTIYLRQGSYRSVSVVESRARAVEVRSRAQQKRADAYIVNMSKWCPVSKEENGYMECVSP